MFVSSEFRRKILRDFRGKKKFRGIISDDLFRRVKEISPMEILHSATLEAASKSLAYVVSAVTEENESPLVVEHRTIPSRPFCRFDASWKDTDTRYVEGSVILVSVRDQTISALACVPDTSKDSSRYVPALDDLSSFAYQSQRSARDPHLISGPFNPT
ncbi:hypothetical protein DY000_02017655 [Brassica cretica]|uniref:Uncharacterized protein n=1 Tax=Brassica cretica TaxID=69181 RepID=A0ABQ7D671_BRACR|nr:hypothetical protein DY000_02017655 [Brassica cretica]